jgi:hypothetical protein
MQAPFTPIGFTLTNFRILIQCLLLIWAGKGVAQSFDVSLISGADYKVDNYIHAAMSLQAMGKEAGCQTLMGLQTNRNISDTRVFVLCRMLFTQRGTNEFRAPFLHNPRTLLGGGIGNWPLNPIALIDGIPFCLNAGEGRDGAQAESAAEYLSYCMANRDWSTNAFHQVTAQEKRDALVKLFSLKQVQQPVTDFARKFYTAQIE